MAEDMTYLRDVFIYSDHPKLTPESKVGDIVLLQIGANLGKYKLTEKQNDGFQSEWVGWEMERKCTDCFHYTRMCNKAINRTVMIQNCFGYKTKGGD